MKAKLTGGQVVSALFAGIFGHLLFGGGWVLLGLVLFGGVLTGILGLTAGGIAQLFSDNPGLSDLFDSAGGIVSSVFVGAAIVAVVLMLIGFLVSGFILKGGKVRKPWGTTFSSVLIVAILTVPLLLVYVGISGRGEGGLPFGLVAFLGTLIVGVLVWLWMTWAHRGPASEFAGISAKATASAPVAATPTTPAVEADKDPKA
jgi:hypothetical protein